MDFDSRGPFNRFGNLSSPGRGGGGQGRRNRFSNNGLTGYRRSAGFGPGRGLRGFVGDTRSDFVPETQLETLKAQAGYLEKVLDEIKRRIQKNEKI